MSAHPQPKTIENMDTTNVHLGKFINFIVVAYRNMGEGLVKRAETTQRKMHHQSPIQRG